MLPFFTSRSRSAVDVSGLSESDAAALQAATDAVAEEPHDLLRRRALAELCAHLGRRDEAVGHYQAIAGVYAAQGLLFRAIAVCKAILELDPNHHETTKTLASLYAAHEARTAPARPPATSPSPAVLPPPLPADAANEPDEVVLPPTMAVAFATDSDAEGAPLLEPVMTAAADDVIDAATLAAITMRDEGSVRLARPAAVPLFSGLPPSAFTELIARLRAWEAEPGAVIVAEGEPGASLFVIARGSVVVERAGVNVGTLSAGDFFGEIAIVTERPRAATVTATTRTQLLEIDRATLDALCARDPHVKDVLDGFCARRLLESTVRTSPLFDGLTADGFERALQRFESVERAAAATLIEQGAPTPGLMVILAGAVDVTARTSMGPVRLKQLGPGDVFGEMGLMTGKVASARCVTTSKSRLAVLSRDALAGLHAEFPALRARLTDLVAARAAFNQRFMPSDDDDDARPGAL